MLVQTNDYKVDGNMPGEVVGFGLSSDSLEHIMDILSDLYSDRPGAIVREYTTNALDAHIISGQTKPVEIRTPNRLNPSLIIRDYGPGMSKQMLIDTYSKYGASSKRTNDLEAGQLGLGSKSAFAYTDQFTVRSVHEGHCCELIMSRNDRGAAEMTIAFDYQTGDESGVTITIPINSEDVYDVVSKVDDFAKFATPGTIEVNGVINKRPEDWQKIADGVYGTSDIQQHMVVMGNVAYPAKFENDHATWRHSKRIIAYVKMGELDFTPSREELKYTNYTKNTLAQVRQYVEDSITNSIKSMVATDDSRLSRAKAVAEARRWSSYFSTHVLTADIKLDDLQEGTEYISARFPSNFSDSEDKIRQLQTKSKHRDKYTMSEYDVIDAIDKKRYAVTDFTGQRITRLQAEKVCKLNPDFAGERVIFFEKSQSAVNDLFPDWEYVSWEDAKLVKLPRKPVVRKHVKQKEGDKYLGQIVHKRSLGASRMLSTNGAAYYISKTEYNTYVTENQMPRGDFKLFFITPKKQEAFCKAHPHVKSLKDYVQNRRNHINNVVRNNKEIREAMRWSVSEHLISWVDNRVTNQDFLDKLAIARRGNKWTRIYGGHSYYHGPFRDYLESNLPLVQLSYSFERDEKLVAHTIWYINMIGEKNVNA